MATHTDVNFPAPPGLTRASSPNVHLTFAPSDEQKSGFPCVRAPQLKPTMWAATQVYEGPFTMHIMDSSTLEQFMEMINILAGFVLQAKWMMNQDQRNVMVNIKPWIDVMEGNIEKLKKLRRVGAFGANRCRKHLYMV